MPLKLGPDLRVLLVDGNGTALSVGGGTQYADGGTQANPTGNVVLWLDTADVLRAASAAKPLPVNIISGAGGTVTDAAAWTTAVSTFVPSGGVFNDSAAVLVSGTQGTVRLTTNRAQHVNLRTAAGTEIGALSNNGAAPVALTQVGVLPSIANAAAPSWTEGRQTLLSTDLAGSLRVSAIGTATVAGGKTNNNAAPGATNVGSLGAIANAVAPTWVEGNQVALSTDLAGFQRGIVMGSSASGATAVGVNPVLMGQNGAGAVVRFLTEANAVSGTTGTGLLGVASMVFDGTNYQKAKGDTTGIGIAIGTVGPAKLEDAGHNSGDMGNFPLAVRQDTQSALAGTTLDYIPFTTDQFGSLRNVAGGYTTVITTSLTRPANTTAYVAGQEMSSSTTAPAVNTITGAARFSGGSGIIQGIYVSQSTLWTVKPAMEIWIFDTTTTPNNDGAAFAPADADVDTAIAVIPLTATYAGTVNQALDSGLISVPFLTVGSANLFFRVVIRNAAQDSANSGVSKFRFRILQD